MKSITRRDFMRYSAAGTLAAGLALPALGQEPAATLSATMERTLGKSGIKCTLLGMGTGTKAWNGSSEQNRQGREAFVSCIEHAYAKGLRYYDMADMYGAHDYVKEALKRSVPRDKVMLLTKTVAKKPEDINADVERFRKELDVDYLDAVLLHCMTDGDWPEKRKAEMDALAELKAQGKIRAIGCSNHTLEALQRAVDSEWVDVILARINPKGVKMDGTPEQVVPLLRKAHDSGKGILGMKIAGEGELAGQLAESLQYVLTLGCVDAITIGFLKPAEIDDAMAKIEAVRA
ncbi:MAG: aldo/keto reductase [FCB group bacterium]|jgi:aryl-alcohol dehydrogenase-like predicted oxidoreductase|nr:aldo/keto reductase [FCB group bacterium]